MKKFNMVVVALMLLVGLCFSKVVVAADRVTVNERTFAVVCDNTTYYAYFDRTNDLPEVEEIGVCYLSVSNKVIGIYNYWYMEGEVVRVYGFSDFLLSPNKLVQITYGVQLTEVGSPRH